MKIHDSIALAVPNVLLPGLVRTGTGKPGPGCDLTRWAVIACDQYTSEPEYWERVREIVGTAPSALNLIYPEVFLAEPELEKEKRIASIREHMKKYVEDGLFEEVEGFVYVERQTGRHTRRGLVVCLDLEHYDFRTGSTSLIRATEGTILDRIPPRVRIRKGAPLEIPHIMVLVDDPQDTVFGPIAVEKSRLNKLYDLDLMMDSGHLAGFRVDDPALERGIVRALEALADPETFCRKYDLKSGTPVLLYAMGDGNHSLATAKSIWETAKIEAGGAASIAGSPLRYALVELVNLHDPALTFEPIHRVVFDCRPGRYLIEEMSAFYKPRFSLVSAETFEDMKAAVDRPQPGLQKIGVINAGGFGIIEISKPDANLPVGTLQNFLDDFMKTGGAAGIDYVHGTNSVLQLARLTGNLGFYLPAMDKNQLFPTVILDGALPRKTFSMGEAWEKRFYMEARKLG